MIRFFLTLLLLLIFRTCYGQSPQLDSLQGVWNNEQVGDSIRLDALHQIIRKTYKKQPDNAIKLIERQLLFAKTMSSIYWESKALNNLGAAYEQKEAFDKSLKYYKQALLRTKAINHYRGMATLAKNIADLYVEELNNTPYAIEYFQESITAAEKAEDYRFQANRYYDLGSIYRKLDELPLAIDCFLNGLKIDKREQNTKGLIRGNRQLANFYQHIKDCETSIKYNEESLQLSQQIGSEIDIAMAYNNIGNCLFVIGEFEKALDYFHQSLAIKQQLDGQPGIANAYHNLGNSYLQKKDIQKASEYYELALNIREKLGKIRDLTNSYCALGEVQLAKKNYNKAIEWCAKGFNAAQAGKELDRAITNCDCLIIAYENLGDYESTLRFQNINSILKDSFNTITANRKISELEAKYQYEDDKNKLLLQQQKTEAAYEVKLQRQVFIQIILISMLVLLAVLAYLIYSNYLTKKRANAQLKMKNEKIISAQEIMEQQAEQLRELDKVKNQFFTQVAHELRTPLTLINVPIQNIQQKHQKTLNPELAEQLAIASRNGKKLAKLVEELLTWQKVDINKPPLIESPTPLSLFVEEIFNAHASIAKEKSIVYEFQSDIGAEKRVLLDQNCLEKIISNLLSNALKFTPANGQVTLELVVKVDVIQIKVSDNGPGISATELPNIFDLYYQASTGKEMLKEGFGIGLAYAKELALLMNGHLEAESQLGLGSAFQLTFPLNEVLESNLMQITESAQMAKPNIIEKTAPHPIVSEDKKPRILIVEDQLDMQTLLRSLLIPNFQIVVANQGKEALDILRKSDPENPIDLILSDIMMPVMDGYSLLDTVKQHENWKQLPFILLTAKAEETDKLTGLRMGVDDYLIKPFSPEELQARIHNLIQNYRNRQILVPEISDAPSREDSSELAQDTPNSIWLAEVEVIVSKAIKKQINLKVSDLSEQLFLSERQLRRRLQQMTGLTPNKYILEIKLNMARQLLESNAFKTVKEAMHHANFHNKSYFSKVYFERFGTSPSGHLGRS